MPEPPRSEPEVAFAAAAIALMVMPLVMLLGLSAFGLAAGLFAASEKSLNLTNAWLVLPFFFGWVVMVGIVVLVFGPRWARRIARQ